MSNSECHFCHTSLIPKLTFGKLPLANSFPAYSRPELLYDAVWSWCPVCELLQLETPPSADQMFTGEYPYLTSSSAVMTQHFEDTATYLYYKYAPTTFGEIGCNDGGVAQFLRERCKTIGFESARACWPALKEKQIQNFDGFNRENAHDAVDLLDGYFDMLYSANTLRSIPDLDSLFEVVTEVLADDGVFIIEEPYLPAILAQGELDQFYDENVYNLTATSVRAIAGRYGLELFDVDALPTHGGSMRYHLRFNYGKPINSAKLDNAFLEESTLESQLDGFLLHVDSVIVNLLYELDDLKLNGKKVVGYGASAKSSTVLSLAGIQDDLIQCVYDNTSEKIGKFLPKSHIEIRDARLFKDDNADVVVLFPWNHSDEIIKRENAIRKRRWLVYVPDVHYL